MKSRKRHATALALFAAALLAVIERPAAGAATIDDWNDRLQAAIGELQAGESAKAVRQIDSLLDKYIESAGRGVANEQNLGILLVYRAIGEVRLGKVEDAHWDWDVASGFLPDTDRLDLSRFGEAGKAILDYAAKPTPREEVSALYQQAAKCEGCALIPPKALRSSKLHYTRGARYFEVEGRLILRVIVDEQGRASRPDVLRKVSAPALALSALEQMREWRFEPARLDGRPIRYFFTMTVNYRMERATSAGPESNDLPPGGR